jgi:lipopolysaccharide export LptBFGC system permease protein LptF
VGVSKSLGLFLAYWLILTLASLAGDRGMLAPWLAGWLPNLGMLSLAATLFLRLR